jgi:oligopeptide transport system substrate-binding protein
MLLLPGRLALLIARGLAAYGLMWTFGGCHRSTPAAAAAAQGILLYANNSEPSDLDPHTNISGDAEAIFSTLFEGLVVLSPDGHGIMPGAAQSWDISGDGLTYTFHLQPNGHWSNGAPVTANDFLFSFRRIFDPLLAAEEASYGYMIVGAEDYNSGKITDPSALGLSAPDERTFVIRLLHPTSYLLTVLGIGTPFVPIYRPAVEKFDGVHHRGTGWTRPGALISNGPFQLSEWKPDQVITVTRNPYYWDQARMKLTAVRIYPIDSAEAQERGFRSGQFHVTAGFPAVKRTSYAAQPSPLQIGPGNDGQFVTFNVARFPDARVRLALSLAIDRRPIVAAVFGRLAEPAHSLVHPGLGNYLPADSPACRFDPLQARALLAAAGFPSGQNFPPIDLMLVGNAPETVRIGEAVQESWSRVLGVHSHLQPTEMKVYLDAERTQHYTAIIERWGPSWDDPTATLQIAVRGNPNNDSGWSDARFDAAYQESDRLPAGPARQRAFDRQEAILAEQVPYAPLYHRNTAHLVSPLLQGWIGNPFEHVNWKGLALTAP